MLRYVRPRRGIRLVWIDVICINQEDPAERAPQVSNMRSVYQQCSRVVIYPGADLVAPPISGIEARMHPPEHGLHEFDRVMGPSLGQREIAMTLPDLLARRYFSRVWVIRELILSRAAVIPVAGREFWATALTPIKYQDARKFNNSSSPDRWDWELSTVPWMRDLCGGSFHVSTTLFDVLCRTWQSKATDPRDKVFGVLGLVDSKSSITPDYNISVQHVLTGIMAHALLNLRITEVLLRASGLAAPPSHPSWLPDKDGISERRPRGFYDFRGKPRHLAISAPPPTTEDYLEQSIVTVTHLGSLPVVQHLRGLARATMWNSTPLAWTTNLATFVSAFSKWAALGMNGKYHFLTSTVFTPGGQEPRWTHRQATCFSKPAISCSLTHLLKRPTISLEFPLMRKSA